LRCQFALPRTGSVQATDDDPHVTIDIDARALPRGLTDPAALLRDAHVHGDADLAQAAVARGPVDFAPTRGGSVAPGRRCGGRAHHGRAASCAVSR